MESVPPLVDPSPMEMPIEQVAEAVAFSVEPMETTALEPLPDLSDPLGEGREFEEYEEIELELPGNRHEQSIPEEEEPEEEQQPYLRRPVDRAPRCASPSIS